MMSAVLDSSVLYPAPLRDLLMRLAVRELYHPRWTTIIEHEWMRAILRTRPDLTPDQLSRTRDLMNTHIPGAMVTNFESLIDTLTLPDPNDRHVLAAAIHAGAGVIVTANLRDFPDSALRQYNIKAEHPDKFIARLGTESIELVIDAARAQRAALKNPAPTLDEFLASLARQGLTDTVQLLDPHRNRL